MDFSERLRKAEDDLRLLCDRMADLEQAWAGRETRVAAEILKLQQDIHTVRQLVHVARQEIVQVQAAQRLALKVPLPPPVVPLRKRSKLAIGIAGVATLGAVIFAITPKTITGNGWSYSSGEVDWAEAAALLTAASGLGWFGLERVRDEKKHRDSTGSNTGG